MSAPLTFDDFAACNNKQTYRKLQTNPLKFNIKCEACKRIISFVTTAGEDEVSY